MLSSFFIQNFRSILELKLDFTYGEGKAPNGYQGHEVMPFLEIAKVPIPLNPITDSTRSRSPIPVQADHRFR
jgi:hypothetical protein